VYDVGKHWYKDGQPVTAEQGEGGYPDIYKPQTEGEVQLLMFVFVAV
jgi:hypothetical protein